METVVMASPDRAHVIGLLEHGNVEPCPAHRHGTRQPRGAGTYDDRVGRFCHASPVSSFASDAPLSRHCDRDRGEPHDSSPPTPPYIRVRIRRFDGLSTVGVSRRAGESDSGVRLHGFGPFERRIGGSPFLIAAKASDLDIRPHGRFEVSTSKRPSIVQAFSETRSAYYAFC